MKYNKLKYKIMHLGKNKKNIQNEENLLKGCASKKIWLH